MYSPFNLHRQRVIIANKLTSYEADVLVKELMAGDFTSTEVLEAVDLEIVLQSARKEIRDPNYAIRAFEFPFRASS